jgi:hypothetical protein
MEFLDYDSHKTGTYLALQPSGPSRLAIERYAHELGLQNIRPAMEFHTTVIYSKTPCPAMRSATIPLPIWATGFKLEIFDPRSEDSTGCVVLELQSEQLMALNKRLTEEYGATSDYPQYRPHITMSFTVPDHLPDIKYPIHIQFDSYVCTPIKE